MSINNLASTGVAHGDHAEAAVVRLPSHSQGSGPFPFNASISFGLCRRVMHVIVGMDLVCFFILLADIRMSLNFTT